jgi:hypothetical protein
MYSYQIKEVGKSCCYCDDENVINDLPYRVIVRGKTRKYDTRYYYRLKACCLECARNFTMWTTSSETDDDVTLHCMSDIRLSGVYSMKIVKAYNLRNKDVNAES